MKTKTRQSKNVDGRTRKATIIERELPPALLPLREDSGKARKWKQFLRDWLNEHARPKNFACVFNAWIAFKNMTSYADFGAVNRQDARDFMNVLKSTPRDELHRQIHAHVDYLETECGIDMSDLTMHFMNNRNLDKPLHSQTRNCRLGPLRRFYDEARDSGDKEDNSDALFQNRNPFSKLKAEPTDCATRCTMPGLYPYQVQACRRVRSNMYDVQELQDRLLIELVWVTMLRRSSLARDAGSKKFVGLYNTDITSISTPSGNEYRLTYRYKMGGTNQTAEAHLPERVIANVHRCWDLANIGWKNKDASVGVFFDVRKKYYGDTDVPCISVHTIANRAKAIFRDADDYLNDLNRKAGAPKYELIRERDNESDGAAHRGMLHRLRRGSAQLALNDLGIEIVHIQEILNHRNINQTAKYCKRDHNGEIAKDAKKITDALYGDRVRTPEQEMKQLLLDAHTDWANDIREVEGVDVGFNAFDDDLTPSIAGFSLDECREIMVRAKRQIGMTIRNPASTNGTGTQTGSTRTLVLSERDAIERETITTVLALADGKQTEAVKHPALAAMRCKDRKSLRKKMNLYGIGRSEGRRKRGDRF